MSPARVVPDTHQLSTGQAMQLVGIGVLVATFNALMATGRHLPAALLAAAVLGTALALLVRDLRRQLAEAAAADAAATPTPLPDWTSGQLAVLHGRWPLPVEQEAESAAVALLVDQHAGTHFAQLREQLYGDALAELNRIGAALRPRGMS